jgi:hypothetical protein
MKLQTTLAAAAAILSMATTAMAADPVVAKLQSPAPAATKPVAGGAVFECLGSVCASRTPTADTASVHGCKELARQVGGVNSYGSTAKPLTSDQVASCNESAKK